MATDALARLASSSKAPLESALIGHQFEPSKLDVGAIDVNCASTESKWMTPIRAYIQEGTLPDNPLEAKKLRMRVQNSPSYKTSCTRRATPCHCYGDFHPGKLTKHCGRSLKEFVGITLEDAPSPTRHYDKATSSLPW